MSISNFSSGIQGLKSLQVFVVVRVYKLVSVFIILRFIIHAMI